MQPSSLYTVCVALGSSRRTTAVKQRLFLNARFICSADILGAWLLHTAVTAPKANNVLLRNYVIAVSAVV